MTISPKNIAKLLKIQVEDVCKILDYDIETMDVKHRKYCFYNHGLDERMFELRLESYGLYLNEGDFEKFQPVCYLDKQSKEFQKLHEGAKLIPISDDPIKETRRLWILNRFTEYQSKEWIKLNTKYQETIIKITDSNLIRQDLKDARYENEKILKLFE